MPRKPKTPTPATDLRHRAERRIADEHATPVSRAETDTRRLLHELEVHQIELEMQNAEMLLARDEAESLLEKYTDLYEFAPVGYFTLAPDGTILLANLTGSTLVGTERSRLIGRSFVLLISPALREGFQVFLQQAFLEPSKWTMEFEVLNPGLPPKPVSIDVQRSPDGEECRVAVVDITSRKREEEILRRQAEKEKHHHAEQARHQRELTAATEALNLSLQAENIAHEKAAATLQENEWRLRYATDSARLTYVEVDFTTGGARTAENFQEVMGYVPQPDQEADASAGSRRLIAHVVPEDRVRVAKALEEFTSGHPVGRIDYRVLGDDRIERWIESRWSVELGPEGTAMKSFATNLDITERKQAEAALRESEQFNRSIVESSPDCIKILDLAGNLLSFLHGAHELLGIGDIRPYLNKPWVAFWEGDDRQKLRTAIAAAAAGGEGNFVGFFRTLRDEPKWWDVRISPVLGADGQPARLLVVSRDVTTRKHAELNLEFLASVSLDLVRLTDVESMMAAVGEKIGTHLGLSLCAIVEIDDAADQVHVTHDWHREDVPGVVGTHRLADFVEPEFIRLARAGETIVVRDTANDPRTTPEKFAALEIASFVCVPLIHHGQWRFAICLYHSTAYAWRDDEIELMREMTARIWTRLERLRAKDALRVSEERYRSLFNSMDEGYCTIEMIFDEQGKPVDYRYLEINPSFERLTGMHGAVGKRVREFVPDLEEHWFEIYGKVALTGEPIRVADEVKGMNRWFDMYAFRIGGNDSRKVAIFFRNITERKLAEEALRQSEDRYHTLFTTIDEGFCIIEMIFDSRRKPVDYQFLEVNPTFEKQTGLNDATGKRMLELVPKIERHWVELYGKVALTGESIRFMNEAKAMGGRWFDAYACRVGGADSRKVAVVFNDITLRKKTEQQLAEKARLLDLSHDAIIVRDMKGHIRYWNHGAEELYGWSREEAMGEVSHLLLKTEFPTPLKHMTEELMRTERWIGELVHTKRNGQRITVLARKTLDRDIKGKPVAVLENLTDITERKQAELAQRHLAVLTASNQTLTEEILHRQAVEKDLHFTQQAQNLLLKQSLLLQEQLRGMSHQILQAQEEERKRISRELHDVIVQSLVGISVHVAALAQEAEGIPRALQLKIARTHRLVEKSVETVHRFARELRPTVLDDLGLIPALHSHLKGFMEDTGIRVSLKAFGGIEKSPAPVLTAIYRVAQEALVNVARHAKASQVEVSIQNLEGVIRLEITDNGEGFDVSTLSHPKNNTRLGLLGMKERVEMVGGIFTVESAPGSPTTIRVEIAPATASAVKRPSKTKPNPSIPPP